jgi:quercetin dioxygenase-like cupin family protein
VKGLSAPDKPHQADAVMKAPVPVSEPRARRAALGRVLATLPLLPLLARPAAAADPTCGAAAGAAPGEVRVKPLQQQAVNLPAASEANVVLLEFPPGAGAAPHRHPGPVFVYVIEGAIEMQVEGGPLTTVRAGEVFYEPPGRIHQVGRNARADAPARAVAFLLGPAGQPVKLPV